MNKLFGKNESFYEKEQKRILDLIKESLLKTILEELPFLQPTKELQDDTWEDISIKINSLYPQENLNLNGLYVKERYQQLMDTFLKQMYDINMREFHSVTAHTIRTETDLRVPVKAKCKGLDRLLYELYDLQDYDVVINSKLSKERFEKKIRALVDDQKTIVTISQSRLSFAESFTDSVDDSHRKHIRNASNAESSKLVYLESELEKRKLKMEQIIDENKRLLELNHSLVEELQGLRSKRE